MDMPLILLLGLIFALGYLGGLLANKAGLPKVSGYVLVGIVLSPTVTGVISHESLKSSSVVVDFALAMVAYALGGSLRLKTLQRHKKDIFYVTFGETAGAYVFVAFGTFLMMDLFNLWPVRNDFLPLALLFGAISLSTAPAATIATVHEYKAKGSFTSTLLAIVALDDAVGLLVFTLVVAFLSNDVLGSGLALVVIVEPVLSILFSSGLGIFAGLVLVWLLKYIQKKETLVIMTVAIFCLTFGMARHLSLEPLFTTMVLGVTVANIYPGEEPFILIEKNYETIVLAVFFVLAGAHIDITILKDYILLAVAFVVLRISGKCAGSYAGGMVSRSNPNIRRYMGVALVPQAGIAIGLALYLERIPALEQFSAMVINVIIANAAVNEVIGPWLLKTVLMKVKEARR